MHVAEARPRAGQKHGGSTLDTFEFLEDYYEFIRSSSCNTLTYANEPPN